MKDLGRKKRSSLLFNLCTELDELYNVENIGMLQYDSLRIHITICQDPMDKQTLYLPFYYKEVPIMLL